MPTASAQVEARNLWMALHQLTLLRRADLAFPNDATDPVSELEGILRHSDNGAIRQKARQALDSLAEKRAACALA